MLNKLAILALGLTILVGCSAPAETTPDATKAPETTTSTPAATPAATAEMKKCEACGAQVAAADLAMDHGKMTCKKCIAAHGH